MIAYSQKVEDMACVTQEVHHGAAPIPEEGKWVKSKNVQDISGLTHGVGWCAPQQGACKLTLNVKDGAHCDISPTLLTRAGIDIPSDMTSKNRVEL